jgi:hypothetical protein
MKEKKKKKEEEKINGGHYTLPAMSKATWRKEKQFKKIKIKT